MIALNEEQDNLSNTTEEIGHGGTSPANTHSPQQKRSSRIRFFFRLTLSFIIVFMLGLNAGYLLWGGPDEINSSTLDKLVRIAIAEQTVPTPTSVAIAIPENYTLPVSYGDIGPQLLEAGAIDYDAFVQTYARNGQPLAEAQLQILTEGSDESIIINRANSYFLLNFFWALGLANKNNLLDEGPIMEYSEGQIERYASTGGWTLAAKPITELYSSALIIELSPKQQERLEEVAFTAYRPCCNNHTAFADCNHGIALLGLLQLLAAQDATVDQMFTTAKYVNSFWFPSQMREVATYFQAKESLAFADIDARQAVSREIFSSSGFQSIHQWLIDNGLLGQPSGGGNSCSV